MRHAHGGALLLIWGIGSAAFGSNACATTERTCNAVGCQMGERLQFDLPELAVHEANVEACRNAQCWQTSVIFRNDRDQLLRFEDASALHAQLLFEPLTTSFRVSAYFPVTDAKDVVLGDALRVTFADAKGSELFTVSGTTQSISDIYPNGRDCESSPCRQGQAEITEP